MKKTLIALLALNGLVMADTPIANVDSINGTYGTVVGGYNANDDKINTAIVTQNAITSSSTYTELNKQLLTEDQWYISAGFNGNVGGYTANQGAITLIAGGPSKNSAVGAIKFTVTAGALYECTGALTLSFDICLTNAGNNSLNHEFTFSLLSSDYAVSSTYNSKSGSNVLSADKTTTASLTLTEDQVATMKQSEKNQTLILLVSTNNITGSNKGVLMSNFQLQGVSLVPEPATATLSLLALAGLAARRRRK